MKIMLNKKEKLLFSLLGIKNTLNGMLDIEDIDCLKEIETFIVDYINSDSTEKNEHLKSDDCMQIMADAIILTCSIVVNNHLCGNRESTRKMVETVFVECGIEYDEFCNCDKEISQHIIELYDGIENLRNRMKW